MSENKKKLKMSEDENLDKNDDFTELDSGYGNINTKVDKKPKFYQHQLDHAYPGQSGEDKEDHASAVLLDPGGMGSDMLRKCMRRVRVQSATPRPRRSMSTPPSC